MKVEEVVRDEEVVEGVDYENNCYQLDVKRNAPKDRVRRPNKPPSHIPAPRANSAGRRLSFGGTAIGATTTTTNCAANKSVMLNDKETWEDEDFDQHELRSSERVFELIPKEPLQIPFAKYNAENTFTEQFIQCKSLIVLVLLVSPRCRDRSHK
ncbi:unnamed protein product [Amoebophrya sp. A120]|nr:unnamed protein product [Amoebophrya sp. A120]|eukprot:GSA120T00013116001.1